MSGNQEGSQSSGSSQDIEINPEINLDLKENSPFQEGVISERFQRLTKHSLKNHVN